MENLQFRVIADSEYSFTSFIAIVRRRKGTIQKNSKRKGCNVCSKTSPWKARQKGYLRRTNCCMLTQHCSFLHLHHILLFAGPLADIQI